MNVCAYCGYRRDRDTNEKRREVNYHHGLQRWICGRCFFTSRRIEGELRHMEQGQR